MRLLVLPLVIAAGCTITPGVDDPNGNAGNLAGETDPAAGAIAAMGRFIASTQLEVDVTSLQATAHITFEAGSAASSTLHLSHAMNPSVIQASGNASLVGDTLVVDGLPASGGTVAVQYTIQSGPAYKVGEFDHTNIGTFLEPDLCGDLFPCHVLPVDGSTFSMRLTGVPDGTTAIYPSTLPEAPSYQLAWVLGNYHYISLGKTTAGTEVGVYSDEPDGSDNTLTAAQQPVQQAFDLLEQMYGRYAYGDHVATVETGTLPEFLDGEEHHPFWHVATGAMYGPQVGIHEATHGWFGDWVRIECWEDLVAKEGLTQYVTARLQIALGILTEENAWGELAYDANSVASVAAAAWPQGCTGDASSLFVNGAPNTAAYYRGAWFFREVARQVGVDALDKALADYYATYGGRAASTSQLLDKIKSSTGFDPQPLANTWLRAATTPQALP